MAMLGDCVGCFGYVSAPDRYCTKAMPMKEARPCYFRGTNHQNSQRRFFFGVYDFAKIFCLIYDPLQALDVLNQH